MEEDKGKLDEFKEIYRGEMLNKEGIHRIEYFGSTKDSWK